MNRLTPKDYKQVIQYTEKTLYMSDDEITQYLIHRVDSMEFLALNDSGVIVKAHLINNIIADKRAINLHFIENWDIDIYHLEDTNSQRVTTVVRVVLFAEFSPVSILVMLEEDFIKLFTLIAFKASLQFHQYALLN